VRRRPDGESISDRAVRRYEIVGALDASGAEAVRLEIRRLAVRFGIEINRLHVEEMDTWWTGRRRAPPATAARRSASGRRGLAKPPATRRGG